MSKFPESWHRHQTELDKARAWLPEIADPPIELWNTNIDTILEGAPIINAGEVMNNRWATARLDDHPFIKNELSDARTKVSVGWQNAFRDGIDWHSASLRWTDPEDTDFLGGFEYNWSDEQGYVIETRTHLEDVFKSSLGDRHEGSRHEQRKIIPDDFVIIETLIGIMTEELEKENVQLNG